LDEISPAKSDSWEAISPEIAVGDVLTSLAMTVSDAAAGAGMTGSTLLEPVTATVSDAAEGARMVGAALLDPVTTTVSEAATGAGMTGASLLDPVTATVSVRGAGASISAKSRRKSHDAAEHVDFVAAWGDQLGVILIVAGKAGDC